MNHRSPIDLPHSRQARSASVPTVRGFRVGAGRRAARAGRPRRPRPGQVLPAPSWSPGRSRRAAGRLDPALAAGPAVVAPARLAAALPASARRGPRQLGLVEAAGGGPDDEVPAADCELERRTPRTTPSGGWPRTCTRTGRPLRPDHVLGVGGASTTLARWTPRRPVGRALDIGTGCGVQAFHLATHARCGRSATDTSRAVPAGGRLNAGLNAAAEDGPFAGRTLDLRRGSLLEPVSGRAVRPRRVQPAVRHHPARAASRRRRTPTGTAGWSATTWSAALVEGVGEVLPRPAAWPSCSATGSTARRGVDRPGRAAGWTRAGCTAGWCSARCRTRRSTPRPGSGTAGSTGQHDADDAVRRLAGRLRRPWVSGRSGSALVTLRRPLDAAQGASAAPGRGAPARSGAAAAPGRRRAGRPRLVGAGRTTRPRRPRPCTSRRRRHRGAVPLARRPRTRR